jgi:galactoside O-acetyltransferase
MCTILGRGRVELEEFCTISVRCSIFSSNDDYSGASMTNPTVPAEYRHATDGPVRVGRHAILGTGCVVLPHVVIGESASVGALSLLKADVPAFAIVAGVPARVIGQRRREHRDLADRFLARR